MDLFEAEVEMVKDLTYDVRAIECRLLDPATIDFKPGQFISFDVPSRGPLPATRPYSIASDPSRSDRITLVLNCVPDGPGSTYLFSLREGDKTRFKGPAGSFYLREDERDLLFVATGTGIAPFLSMLAAELHRPAARRIRLFWGLRSQRDLYYQDELAELSREHSRFSYVTTLSRPEPGWTGPTGRVTAHIETSVPKVNNLSVYLCGNGAMIKDVIAVLRPKGLCPIYREQYYQG